MVRLLDTRVTQFEMREAPRDRVPPPDVPYRLDILSVPRIPVSFYAFLYGAVGKPHHWTSRLLSNDALAAEIHRDGVAVHVLYADASPAGWFELDWQRKPNETRLVHFAILPEFRGLGLSRWLLGEAIAAAFATGRPLVTLETNSLDHPAAAKLYREAGFVSVSMRIVSTRAIEG